MATVRTPSGGTATVSSSVAATISRGGLPGYSVVGVSTGYTGGGGGGGSSSGGQSVITGGQSVMPSVLKPQTNPFAVGGTAWTGTSSSGGQSYKPITSGGQVTGYDTGTQSIVKPQIVSQQIQDAQRVAIQSNVLQQYDAVARDSNYNWNTKTTEPSKFQVAKALISSAFTGATGATLGAGALEKTSLTPKQYYSTFVNVLGKELSPTKKVTIGDKNYSFVNVKAFSPIGGIMGIQQAGMTTSFVSKIETLKTEKIQKEQRSIIEGFNTKYQNVTGEVSDSIFNEYQKDLAKLGSMGITKTNITDSGFTLTTKELSADLRPIYYKQSEALGGLETTKGKAYLGATAGAILVSSLIQGTALAGTGIVGGASRGLEYLGEAAPKTATTLKVIFAGGMAADVGLKSYEGYKFSGDKISGAVTGGGFALTGMSGFFTGASKGEFLFVPGLKYREVGIPNSLGNAPTKVLALENPFGKGAIPLVTKSPSGLSVGYPSKITGETFGLTPKLAAGEYGYQAASKTEVGFLNKALTKGENRLFTEQVAFEKGLDIARGLSGVKIKDVNPLQLEKSSVFENLGTNVKAKQIISETFKELGASQKGWRGFFNAVTNKGLERIYGSSTISSEGGFNTNVNRPGGKFGDFDLNFRNKAIPKAEELFGKLKVAGADARLTGSLIEIKNPKTGQYEHAFDFHGADTPDLQMSSLKLGIKGVNTKLFGLDGGSIKGQQLRQSLIDKGSATLQLRINKEGKFFLSPPDYRMKDVTDFVSIAERLNVVKGGNQFGPKIESYKNILGVTSPGLKFGGQPNNELILGSLAGKSKPSLFKIDLGTISSNSKSTKQNNELSLATDIKSSSASIISKPSIYSIGSQKSLSPSISPSKSLSPSLSPGSPYSPYLGPFPSKSPGPSKSPSISPSPSKSQSPSLSPSPYGSPYSPSPYPSGLGLPSLGGFAIGVPKGLGRKAIEKRIAPSFTAIVGNIKATKQLSVSKTFGVNPFQTRGTYTSKVGPKNYFKEIDF